MVTLRSLERLRTSFLSQRPLRSASLIVTVFGDTVSQHGGRVWLGSLVRVLGSLGLDERLVRTSVFRLVRDGWLRAEKAGRRSFYQFSPIGQKEYERAARRIYRERAPVWDGTWTVVIPVSLPDSGKERFKKSLHWQGFGSLASGVYARPGAERRSLDDTLDEMGLSERVIVMRAETLRLASEWVMHEAVRQGWRVDELARRYREFLERFRPIERALKRAKVLDPQSCFQLRTLLVHEYRRILLHDADLPTQLLPRRWPGVSATRLTKGIYRQISEGAVRYIETTLEARQGLVGTAGGAYFARFGGLPRRVHGPLGGPEAA